MMAFKIGFCSEQRGEAAERASAAPASGSSSVPRRSVVQVHFPKRDMTLAYYNDRFDLHEGDLVFVDGKLAGLRGCVTEVSYNFKIRAADYQRVIAVADTDVHGEFFFADSHFITFEPDTLPAGKVSSWFKAPAAEDEFLCGSDETAFRLNDLHGMKVSPEVAERGHKYYVENKVRYLCVDGSRGYAIVEGTEPYEVEFTYRNGEISALTCSCFCSYSCKHEFAAMLQLGELLRRIEEQYADDYARTGYFAAIYRETLLSFTVDGRENGSLRL